MNHRFTLTLLESYAAHARERLIHKTKQVMETQELFLREFIQAHKNTELGQQFDLSTIKTLDQFRERIPVLPYSFYEPYTERIAQGDRGVLNPDPVVYINLTSGTTSRKKQVPVTRRYQRTLRRADLASMGFAIAEMKQRRLPFGKGLLTNAVPKPQKTSGGIPTGPVSVGSIRQGRLLFEQLFSQPFDALEIADTLARHYVCLLFALCHADLRGWVANFPMLMLRTCRYLETYAEELIHDLEQGAIAPWLQLEPHLRAQLERRFTAAPQRATDLRATLYYDGRLTPKAAWPGLSYLTTARGGTSNFYLERFPDYFGDIPVFGGVYGTAEATFGVYPSFNTDGSILAIESGFFEFVPQDQWHVEQPKTLLPVEVKVGERYRILVTSYSGFYRYDIGDVVEVVGFYEQAPLIVFRHRQGGLLSSTTEKTTEFHAIQVMEQVQREFNIKLQDFCITLSAHEFPARYWVNIELAPGYSLARPYSFLMRFEHWLQQTNLLYASARQDQVPPPCLRVLAAGSFATLHQRQVQRGIFDSQLKLPHISEDRTLLEGLPVQYEIGLSDFSNATPFCHSESDVSLSDVSLSDVALRGNGSELSSPLCEPAPQVQPQTLWEPPPCPTRPAPELPCLRGTNLLQADLAGIDFSGQDLSYADLSGANLQGAVLRGANLTGALLREANLSDADLSESLLVNTDLTDARLHRACLRGAMLDGAFLTRTDFSYADLSDANLSKVLMWHTNFSHAKHTLPALTSSPML
ncbi:GH3 auxin-responsive promoter [Thermoleptolyngbya oregonensis NK1-22]|uniref:GH3 auxin-responsive promoter n=1 Tax=Thermoleptolyngbya oregonensis NK1-22 TaxID=2547457 RepID=A0AA96Y3J6_9CYAN|nr:GH3 auxin-responsive promoter [Thermoleptolyngbya oregonensis NK1-22]